MDTVPLDFAFARLGADVSGRYRPLCATAEDGSFVLVCQSSGFSRPRAGVLRYSAKLSLMTARRTEIETLRIGLDAASAARTPVRLIIRTSSVAGASSTVHFREDLLGSIEGYDGDAYSVDFVRPIVEEPEPPPRERRRR